MSLKNISGRTAQGQRHCTVIRGRRHRRSVADCRHAISRWWHMSRYALAAAVTIVGHVNWPIFFRSFIFSTPFLACPLVCLPGVIMPYHVELFLSAICPASDGFVVLVCAHLWWVECVTRRECDEFTGDKLTVWRLNYVMSWLVAFGATKIQKWQSLLQRYRKTVNAPLLLNSSKMLRYDTC